MSIRSFSGEYRFLSNFDRQTFELIPVWDVPLVATGHLHGAVATSGEHAFQAAKTFDVDEASWVLAAATPKEAKRRGQRVKLRPDWEQIKVVAMIEVLGSRFFDVDRRSRLLATGGEDLIEGNTWHDVSWGVCTCPKHRGVGDNYLGRSLMWVREAIGNGASVSADGAPATILSS